MTEMQSAMHDNRSIFFLPYLSAAMPNGIPEMPVERAMMELSNPTKFISKPKARRYRLKKKENSTVESAMNALFRRKSREFELKDFILSIYILYMLPVSYFLSIITPSFFLYE
jgi:hypothetical protein